MKRTLSIVIPCYNESGNIPKLFEQFKKINKQHSVDVVFVDNGSTDDTRKRIERLLPTHQFARIVALDHNRGYGGGILAGLKACKTSFVGWTHANLQTDPEDILKVFPLLQENNFSEKLFIKGKRTGRPLLDTMMSQSMSFIETMLFQKKICEVNAQPNIIHRSHIDKWNNPPSDFSLELYTYLYALNNDLYIERVEVEYPSSKFNESRLTNGPTSIARFVWNTLKSSFDMRIKPRS